MTTLPGTCGRNWECSFRIASGKGSGAVSDATGAASSRMVELVTGGISMEASNDMSHWCLHGNFRVSVN